MLAPRTSTTTATMWPPLSMAEPGVCAPIDANGNLTSDGTRTFEWDARNQMLAVDTGTHRVEFSYDAQQRRVRLVEKVSGVTQSDQRVLFCDNRLCEERGADGTTISRRTFGLSEQVAGVAQFLASDHLGSINELTGQTGALVARYAFDPWGRRTTTVGTAAARAGFTGHQLEAVGGTTGLAMTLHRAYDPDLARWLSADPIGPDELGNEYAYVRNNPLAFVDPLGLVEVRWNERVRFGDPDIACSRQTGGACSRAGAAVTGFCQPECGGYKMNSLLFVNADITVSPGPYPYKGRKPRDPSVRDAESAFVHEFRVHLIPAASAAAAVLAVFEQPLYPSESACRLAIGIARTVAVGRFNAVLAETMTNDR